LEEETYTQSIDCAVIWDVLDEVDVDKLKRSEVQINGDEVPND
jgi:hypothetical protein